jgi:hypothetical protein
MSEVFGREFMALSLIEAGEALRCYRLPVLAFIYKGYSGWLQRRFRVIARVTQLMLHFKRSLARHTTRRYS